MINEKIKMIVEGFLNSVKLPAILIGTCTGVGVQVDAKFVIPMAQISGNMKSRMRSEIKYVCWHPLVGRNSIFWKL